MTIDLANCSSIDVAKKTELWNAIVIGAGPSGALAAHQIAKSFGSVLLIDKARFPRYKVCGCCLNLAALDALNEAGLDVGRIGGVKLESIRLHDRGQRSQIPLFGSLAVSRELLDYYIINSAVELGVEFLQLHSATLLQSNDDFVRVRVANGQGEEQIVSAKVVIIADGLSGRSLDSLPEFAVSVCSGSRFGAGCLLPSAAPEFEPGRIYMCCSDEAYVGLVALEDGSLDVAAAFDKDFSRKNEGPSEAARKIILSAGLPLPSGYSHAIWTGTNSLTRRRNSLAGRRIFVVGDSCGYAEPFTGEGISWALWSALAVTRVACEAIREWHPALISEWNSIHSKLFDHRHSRSNLIAKSLRNTVVRRAALALFSSLPDLARPLSHQLSGHSMKKDYLDQFSQAS